MDFQVEIFHFISEFARNCLSINESEVGAPLFGTSDGENNKWKNSKM